jgi:hypothetical protein
MSAAACAGLLLAASAAGGGELEKKIEAETGTPVANERALNCAGAISIACPATVQGSNVGATNGATSYSCVSWNESGGEVIYAITLSIQSSITATLSGLSADLDLFLVSSCSASSCVAYGDNSFTSAYLMPGTYYLVVDGYNGASGSFTLAVTCLLCMPVANDNCALAIDLCPPGGSGSFNRTYGTVCANNDYSLPFGNPCTGYTTNGSDVVYRVCLAPGGSIDVTQTGSIDMALYLVTDCSNVAASCVAGSDVCCTGAPERLVYTSPAGGTYFLIVDAYTYQGQTYGTLSGTITGCCGTGTDEASWGRVKGFFR